MELPFAVSEEPEPIPQQRQQQQQQPSSSSTNTPHHLPPRAPPNHHHPHQHLSPLDPYGNPQQTQYQQQQQQTHLFHDSSPSVRSQQQQNQRDPSSLDHSNPPHPSFDDDFTHISVYEESDDDRHGNLFAAGTDDDILIDANTNATNTTSEMMNDTALGGLHQAGDVLTVLLRDDAFVEQTETASKLAIQASEAKKSGDLETALEYHVRAAKMYQSIATKVRDRNASMANSMLLLSQSQIKSAMVLKRIVKLSPDDLNRVLPEANSNSDDSKRRQSSSSATSSSSTSKKDRLRAAVRGALGSKHPHEADLSDSMFLGQQGTMTTTNTTTSAVDETRESDDNKDKTNGVQTVNPVDDMMELERELRDMDMALDLGNSIGSLDALVHNRMHKTGGNAIDGSFMVVPPGSNSYMSSSSMWGAASGHHLPTQQGSRVRARANRVQSKVSKSQHGGVIGSQLIAPAAQPHNQPNSSNNNSLESSWWGGPSSNSASIMASSILSVEGNSRGVLAAGPGPIAAGGGDSNLGTSSESASTKQLMRLMDALKTLGDENASLMREVEEAEVARAEAKAAKAQMKRFQSEYNERFAKLKAALEKFRKEHAAGNVDAATANVVNNSDFVRAASVSDQITRQEQLIRKLTLDLKKEKEESKRKDVALRKYESFYREVKARSAQKAAQRQTQPQPPIQQQQQQPNLRRPGRTMRIPH